MNFDTLLAALPLEEKQASYLGKFYHNYKNAALANGCKEIKALGYFKILLHLIVQNAAHPFEFAPFHKAVTSPFDYYTFGLDFMRPLVKEPIQLMGTLGLKQIKEALAKKENVVLFANHQTEADPQFLSLALAKEYPQIALDMIFVAGERVVTDPLAIPFSMGRNLLCIYSKRYIDHPPEEKLQKQLHNKKTMEQMAELLKEGGQIIYVAPSGGRDRKDTEGVIQVAPFDPQSLEMFLLMARKAKTKTHFHTLALSTYERLPPPVGIQIALGEERRCQAGPIGFYFGNQLDLEKYNHISDKHGLRSARAEDLFNEVKNHYQALIS